MFMRHPNRTDLFRHVENRVAGAPIQADMAAHIRRCPKCAQEAKAMEATLQLSDSFDVLEPSDDLTNKILQRARAERASIAQAGPRASWAVVRLARVGALAAALLVVTTLSFTMTSGPAPAHSVLNNVLAPSEYLGSIDRPAGISQAQREINTLADAVTPARTGGDGLVEQAHRRAIAERDADISAALSALEANPGSIRARNVVRDSVERQAETYKSLYINRSL